MLDDTKLCPTCGHELPRVHVNYDNGKTMPCEWMDLPCAHCNGLSDRQLAAKAVEQIAAALEVKP